MALAGGFGAVIRRAAALKEPASAASVRRVMRADLDWGIAAAVWIATGLWRYIGGVEKDMAYYNHNLVFLAKMGLFLLIFALEIWPMLTLAKWRAAMVHGSTAEAVAVPAVAQKIARISGMQALLVVIMVFLAVSMARGFGGFP